MLFNKRAFPFIDLPKVNCRSNGRGWKEEKRVRYSPCLWAGAGNLRVGSWWRSALRRLRTMSWYPWTGRAQCKACRSCEGPERRDRSIFLPPGTEHGQKIKKALQERMTVNQMYSTGLFLSGVLKNRTYVPPLYFWCPQIACSLHGWKRFHWQPLRLAFTLWLDLQFFPAQTFQ